MCACHDGRQQDDSEAKDYCDRHKAMPYPVASSSLNEGDWLYCFASLPKPAMAPHPGFELLRHAIVSGILPIVKIGFRKSHSFITAIIQ